MCIKKVFQMVCFFKSICFVFVFLIVNQSTAFSIKLNDKLYLVNKIELAQYVTQYKDNNKIPKEGLEAIYSRAAIILKQGGDPLAKDILGSKKNILQQLFAYTIEKKTKNRREIENSTALFEALLKNKNVDVNNNQGINKGSMPLMRIMVNKKPWLLDNLLQQPELNINALDKDGSSALFYAKDTVSLRLLLKHKNIDPNIRNKEKFTALTKFIYERQNLVQEFMKSVKKIDVNVRNSNGDTILHQAVMGRLALEGLNTLLTDKRFKKLLKIKVIKGYYKGLTPLGIAKNILEEYKENSKLTPTDKNLEALTFRVEMFEMAAKR